MKDKTICYCKNVKKSQIEKAIQDGAKNLGDIQRMTKACTGNRCKELNPKGSCCSEDIIKILKDYGVSDTKSTCCSYCNNC